MKEFKIDLVDGNIYQMNLSGELKLIDIIDKNGKEYLRIPEEIAFEYFNKNAEYYNIMHQEEYIINGKKQILK